MNTGLIKSLDKESAEQFKQRLDKLPAKKLVQELTEHFTNKTENEFTVLSYLIQSANKEGSPEKFRYSLEKLSQIKGFDLNEYLNYYVVNKDAMFKGAPLYLLAAFHQSSGMMQDLYDFGVNPNVKMTNEANATLTGDDVVQAMSTASNQTLVEKHNELKARHLEANLNNALRDKPGEKKVKL